MSLLLIGTLDDEDYADWRRHLHAHLPPDETLVLATETHDADAVDVALVANPPPGALARY